MSKSLINNNQSISEDLVIKVKKQETEYYQKYPDSLIPKYAKELHELGFVFEISSQAYNFMPKHWKSILPVAINYYQMARDSGKENEQNYFLSFFGYRQCQSVVPMLLQNIYSPKISSLTQWFIADCLYKIRSKEYIQNYIQIAINPKFGINRQMIVLLLGKLKDKMAIPVLVDLLQDESVCLQAINALSNFKEESSVRFYFEQFLNSPNLAWKRAAISALKKLKV